jgi:hypothetical protein
MNNLYFHPTVKGNFNGKPFERRATVAGVPNINGTMSLGLAVCSEKDQFVKKVGRAKAEGRALSHEKRTVINVPEDRKGQLTAFLDAAISGLKSLGYEILPRAKKEITIMLVGEPNVVAH